MARTWVLLRGLIRESRHWEGFPARLRERFPADEVLTLDLPGNGVLHDLHSPVRVELMVASVREALARAGREPPFHVVALSLGAMTAVDWLHRFPQEVAGAVLMNTSAPRFSPFWHRLRPANYRRILVDGLLTKDRLRRERAILAITSNLLGPDERDAVARRWQGYAQTHGTTRSNALRQIWAALRFRAPEALPEEVPVLILNGAGDRLVDPACSRALSTAWKVPLAVHPQAGHDLTLDAGVWTADSIAAWLENELADGSESASLPASA